MLATAAVLWALVGVSYVARAGGSDVLNGVGGLFVGLAALVASCASAIAAAGSWVSGRQAKENSAEAVKSIGPATDTSLRELLGRHEELLKEIKGFESYVHERNHDVLNHLAGFKLALPTLIELCQELLTEIRRLREEGP